MENETLIAQVVMMIVALLLHDLYKSLMKRIRANETMLKASLIRMLNTHFRLIDGIFDMVQAGVQGWASWSISAQPCSSHQMFFVAFTMCMAAFFLKEGIEKIVTRD